MCSVVGYIGKNFSRDFVLEGLARLEYRGYDSAGFACLSHTDNCLKYIKSEGKLENLVKKFDQFPLDGFVGIGHTRWSTHGTSSIENAHPQLDCLKKLSVVHNGIIENHHELRETLRQAGHVFLSETDTEIIAHLFEDLLVFHHTLVDAVTHLVNRLDGAYAFISTLQDNPDELVLVRKRSPLCIGIGENEMFVASDMLAFAGKTKKVLFLPDESFALLKKDSIELYDFAGNSLPLNIQEVNVNWVDQEKRGHQHFMLKEIYEQKATIHATIDSLKAMGSGIWESLGLTAEQVEQLETINLIGCGTSWHAARIAQFFFETVCMIPTQVHLASEFLYKPFFPRKKDLYMVISQSGETADILQVLRLIKETQIPVIALTNVGTSTLARQAQGFLLTQAGYEVAVASTKAFSTQLTALYWFAHRLALQKGIVSAKDMAQAEEDLAVAAEVLESSIENYKFDFIGSLAKKYAQFKKYIFLGRHSSYPFAMEAALKLKEISYIFAQCYPAGELKHGPLALVDEQTPIFLFSHQDPIIYQKLVANAQEAKARGGRLIVFAFEGQDELCELAEDYFLFPKVKPLLGPLAMTGLMQFFAYQVALELGCPIDKPRNLAKSVTVE